jgi:hypothetical protein
MSRRERAGTVSARAACAALLLGPACAGSEPAPRSARAAAVEPARGSSAAQRHDSGGGDDGPTVTAEIGGLPPEGVAATFQQAEGKIFACFQRGLERVSFLGGSVRFFVKVDLKGKFMHAHLEKSDLGDRATEQCLLDVLMGYRWPTPVGGKVGVATFEMSFDHAPDVRPPLAWEPDRVADTLAEHAQEIEECRSGVEGPFIATVYVQSQIEKQAAPEAKGAPAELAFGRALTASATPPDEAGEMAVDCIVGVLKQARYPAPGSAPVKVVFRLEQR